jgi:hypothetical protein
MKDLIIGACYNYTYDQIKFWINSINKCGFNGDKVLIFFDGDEAIMSKVKEQGFKTTNIPMNGDMAVHVLRFLSIYDYLYQNDYRYVVTTDVRDVVFQSNPIEWLEKNLVDDYKMVVSSECLNYEDEEWNNHNLIETYGPFVHERFKKNEVYNVGILGGHSNFIRDLCLTIVLNCINRPIKICDQSVFNVTIQNEIYTKQTYFARMINEWAVNLGTTADPRKMHIFRPKLLEAEPTFDGNQVLTVNNKPLSIVHQYDRTVWRERLEEIYG